MIVAISLLLALLIACLVFMLVYGTRTGSRPSFFGVWITAGGVVTIAAIVFVILHWQSAAP